METTAAHTYARHRDSIIAQRHDAMMRLAGMFGIVHARYIWRECAAIASTRGAMVTDIVDDFVRIGAWYDFDIVLFRQRYK